MVLPDAAPASRLQAVLQQSRELRDRSHGLLGAGTPAPTPAAPSYGAPHPGHGHIVTPSTTAAPPPLGTRPHYQNRSSVFTPPSAPPSSPPRAAYGSRGMHSRPAAATATPADPAAMSIARHKQVVKTYEAKVVELERMLAEARSEIYRCEEVHSGLLKVIRNVAASIETQDMQRALPAPPGAPTTHGEAAQLAQQVHAMQRENQQLHATSEAQTQANVALRKELLELRTQLREARYRSPQRQAQQDATFRAMDLPPPQPPQPAAGVFGTGGSPLAQSPDAFSPGVPAGASPGGVSPLPLPPPRHFEASPQLRPPSAGGDDHAAAAAAAAKEIDILRRSIATLETSLADEARRSRSLQETVAVRDSTIAFLKAERERLCATPTHSTPAVMPPPSTCSATTDEGDMLIHPTTAAGGVPFEVATRPAAVSVARQQRLEDLEASLAAKDTTIALLKAERERWSAGAGVGAAFAKSPATEFENEHMGLRSRIAALERQLESSEASRRSLEDAVAAKEAVISLMKETQRCAERQAAAGYTPVAAASSSPLLAAPGTDNTGRTASPEARRSASPSHTATAPPGGVGDDAATAFEAREMELLMQLSDMEALLRLRDRQLAFAAAQNAGKEVNVKKDGAIRRRLEFMLEKEQAQGHAAGDDASAGRAPGSPARSAAVDTADASPATHPREVLRRRLTERVDDLERRVSMAGSTVSGVHAAQRGALRRDVDTLAKQIADFARVALPAVFGEGSTAAAAAGAASATPLLHDPATAVRGEGSVLKKREDRIAYMLAREANEQQQLSSTATQPTGPSPAPARGGDGPQLLRDLRSMRGVLDAVVVPAASPVRSPLTVAVASTAGGHARQAPRSPPLLAHHHAQSLEAENAALREELEALRKQQQRRGSTPTLASPDTAALEATYEESAAQLKATQRDYDNLYKQYAKVRAELSMREEEDCATMRAGKKKDEEEREQSTAAGDRGRADSMDMGVDASATANTAAEDDDGNVAALRARVAALENECAELRSAAAVAAGGGNADAEIKAAEDDAALLDEVQAELERTTQALEKAAAREQELQDDKAQEAAARERAVAELKDELAHSLSELEELRAREAALKDELGELRAARGRSRSSSSSSSSAERRTLREQLAQLQDDHAALRRAVARRDTKQEAKDAKALQKIQGENERLRADNAGLQEDLAAYKALGRAESSSSSSSSASRDDERVRTLENDLAKMRRECEDLQRQVDEGRHRSGRRTSSLSPSPSGGVGVPRAASALGRVLQVGRDVQREGSVEERSPSGNRHRSRSALDALMGATVERREPSVDAGVNTEADARGDVGELWAQLEAQRRDNGELKQEIVRMRNDIAQKDTLIAMQQQQQQQQQREEPTASAATMDSDDAESEAGRLKNENASLQQVVTLKDEVLQRMQERINSLIKDKDSEDNGHRTTVRILEDQANASAARLAASEEEMRFLQQRYDLLQGEMDVRAKEGEVSRDKAVHDAATHTLRISALQDENANLRTLIEAKEERIADLEKRIVALTGENEKLRVQASLFEAVARGNEAEAEAAARGDPDDVVSVSGETDAVGSSQTLTADVQYPPLQVVLLPTAVLDRVCLVSGVPLIPSLRAHCAGKPFVAAALASLVDKETLAMEAVRQQQQPQQPGGPNELPVQAPSLYAGEACIAVAEGGVPVLSRVAVYITTLCMYVLTPDGNVLWGVVLDEIVKIDASDGGRRRHAVRFHLPDAALPLLPLVTEDRGFVDTAVRVVDARMRRRAPATAGGAPLGVERHPAAQFPELACDEPPPFGDPAGQASPLPPPAITGASSVQAIPVVVMYSVGGSETRLPLTGPPASAPAPRGGDGEAAGTAAAFPPQPQPTLTLSSDDLEVARDGSNVSLNTMMSSFSRAHNVPVAIQSFFSVPAADDGAGTGEAPPRDDSPPGSPPPPTPPQWNPSNATALTTPSPAGDVVPLRAAGGVVAPPPPPADASIEMETLQTFDSARERKAEGAVWPHAADDAHVGGDAAPAAPGGPGGEPAAVELRPIAHTQSSSTAHTLPSTDAVGTRGTHTPSLASSLRAPGTPTAHKRVTVSDAAEMVEIVSHGSVESASPPQAASGPSASPPADAVEHPRGAKYSSGKVLMLAPNRVVDSYTIDFDKTFLADTFKAELVKYVSQRQQVRHKLAQYQLHLMPSWAPLESLRSTETQYGVVQVRRVLSEYTSLDGRLSTLEQILLADNREMNKGSRHIVFALVHCNVLGGGAAV